MNKRLSMKNDSLRADFIARLEIANEALKNNTLDPKERSFILQLNDAYETGQERLEITVKQWNFLGSIIAKQGNQHV